VARQRRPREERDEDNKLDSSEVGSQTRPKHAANGSPDASRVTIPLVNAELSRRGYAATLVKAGRYFYFAGTEPSAWLDRTVRAEKISDLTVAQWIEEFKRLRKQNLEALHALKAARDSKS
jgi:hypothetical protein